MDSALTTGTDAAEAKVVVAFLTERAPDDRVDIPRQDTSGVFQRLLAAELGIAAVDHYGVPAELRDAHLKGEPGPGGILVEDDRRRAAQPSRADGPKAPSSIPLRD